jgi:hypothetical protein
MRVLVEFFNFENPLLAELCGERRDSLLILAPLPRLKAREMKEAPQCQPFEIILAHLLILMNMCSV